MDCRLSREATQDRQLREIADAVGMPGPFDFEATVDAIRLAADCRDAAMTALGTDDAHILGDALAGHLAPWSVALRVALALEGETQRTRRERRAAARAATAARETSPPCREGEPGRQWSPVPFDALHQLWAMGYGCERAAAILTAAGTPIGKSSVHRRWVEAGLLEGAP